MCGPTVDADIYGDGKIEGDGNGDADGHIGEVRWLTLGWHRSAYLGAATAPSSRLHIQERRGMNFFGLHPWGLQHASQVEGLAASTGR